MNAISTTKPGIHINGYADLSFKQYDHEPSPTGKVYAFALGDIYVYVNDLDHLQHLAQQIVDYCETGERARRDAVADAVAI